MATWLLTALANVASSIGLVKTIGNIFINKLEQLASKTATPIDDEGVALLKAIINAESYTLDTVVKVTLAQIKTYVESTPTELDDLGLEIIEVFLREKGIIK